MIQRLERQIIHPQIKVITWKEYESNHYEMIENLLLGVLLGMCVYDYWFFG